MRQWSRGRAAVLAAARLLVLALTVVIAGCDSHRELRIATVPWIGYETLTLAGDLGWLPARVELERMAIGDAALEALRRGSVDAATVSLEEALRLALSMPSLRIVLVMDESAGGDVLLARPGIGSVAELAQRPVAFERFGVTMMLTYGALSSEGMSFADIRPVELSVDQHPALYRSGAIDAAASFMPFAQQLIDAGATPIFDSRALPGVILDVLAVDADRLRGRRRLLREVIAAHFRALRHLRRNRDDAVYRIAGYQDQPAKTIRRALDGVRLPELEAVRAQLAAGSDLRLTTEQLVDAGALAAAPALDVLLDASFLPAPAAR